MSLMIKAETIPRANCSQTFCYTYNNHCVFFFFLLLPIKKPPPARSSGLTTPINFHYSDTAYHHDVRIQQPTHTPWGIFLPRIRPDPLGGRHFRNDDHRVRGPKLRVCRRRTSRPPAHIYGGLAHPPPFASG